MVTGLWVRWLCGYLVCDSSENHGVGHQRVSIDESLGLGEVLHRDPKHQLMVEPVNRDNNIEIQANWRDVEPRALVASKSMISNAVRCTCSLFGLFLSVDRSGQRSHGYNLTRVPHGDYGCPHWTGCQRRNAIILLWSVEQSLFTLQTLTDKDV